MAMADKIVRGSPIGEAHSQGALGPRPAPRRSACESRYAPLHLNQKEWVRLDGTTGRMTPTAPGSPRFARGHPDASSPPQSPRNLGKAKSARCLKEQDHDVPSMTPRSPPHQKVITANFPYGDKTDGPPKALLRGKSESWLAARGPSSPRCASPRDMICDAKRQAAEERPAAGRCTERSPRASNSPEPRSPRASSPTFRTSEEWWGYSAPSSTKKAETPKADPMSMPSANFSSRLRRCHSGRVSEQSENWMKRDGENVRQSSPSPLCNSENYIPSKGKKVGLRQDPDMAKRRIRLDNTEPAPGPATQRKFDFPSHPQMRRHQEQLSEEPAAADRRRGGQPSTCLQHRTSPELLTTMKPEAPSSGARVKIMVGTELMDLSSQGRRAAPVCLQAWEPRIKVSPRDHRNSDAVREHLQAPVTVIRAPAPPGCYPAPQFQTGHCVYSDGSSCLPSTMPKDTAYLHTGTTVTKYSPRSPGTFSPNVPRVSAVRLIQASG